MGDQKDLPKPQTDLPLPEKEIPATTGSALGQNDGDKKRGSSIFMSKFFLGFIVLSTLIAFIAGGFMVANKNSAKQVACTQEAKICPDGSSVGRAGPKCEFAKCPTPPTPISTADWKKYVGDGFSFSYPKDFEIQKQINNSVILSSIYTGLQLDSQAVPYSNLKIGDKYIAYLEAEKGFENFEFTIKTSEKSQTINLDGKDALTYWVSCGSDCGLYVLEFNSNNKYYRLAYHVNGAGADKDFDQILSTFKFTQ